MLTCFDLLGLAAVPGYISLIFTPTSAASRHILDYFGVMTSIEILLPATLCLALFFCMKFAFSVFVINYENKFVYYSTSILSLRVAQTISNPRFFQINDTGEGEKSSSLNLMHLDAFYISEIALFL